jgi:hypothetical protein
MPPIPEASSFLTVHDLKALQPVGESKHALLLMKIRNARYLSKILMLVLVLKKMRRINK